MQSAAAAVRALVMLAFVVAVPAIALRGTSWSQMASRLQNCDWSGVLKVVWPTNTPAVVKHDTQIAESPTVLAPTQAPAAADRQAATVASSFASTSSIDSQGVRGQSLSAGESAMPAPAGGERGPAVASTDEMETAAVPLRHLGARRYRLESWGDGRHLYHFYCDVAVGDNPDYTRCFEATHTDPLQAIRQVQRQVETWREVASGGSGGGRRTASDRLLTSGR